MKFILPFVSTVIIAILGGALRYEIVLKNRIGADTAKAWQQLVIIESVRNYQDLDRGDVNTVKENLKTVATVYSKYYAGKFGMETGTKFATTLSEGLALQTAYQADQWASLTNSMK